MQKYLIDGFPRNIEQAIELESIFTEIKLIINYECPEETLVQRLLGRGFDLWQR